MADGYLGCVASGRSCTTSTHAPGQQGATHPSHRKDHQAAEGHPFDHLLAVRELLGLYESR